MLALFGNQNYAVNYSYFHQIVLVHSSQENNLTLEMAGITYWAFPQGYYVTSYRFQLKANFVSKAKK